MDDLRHILFENRQNPKAQFDTIRLETVATKKGLDHSPYSLHIVEFFILFFVEDGQGSHTIDFIDYSCRKGTILTIRKDQIHKFIKGGNLKGNLLLFTDNFLSSYLEKLESQKSLQLFNELLGSPKIELTNKNFKEIKNLINRINDEYFKVNDDYSLGIIRSELQILIAKLYRIKSAESNTISQKKYLSEFILFQELVENNVNTTNKVQDYAKMMAMSTKTLNNITKTILSKTAKEFIDEISIKQIKRLLINTEQSIKEIAYSSGFEESTNFYKYFKRHVAMTPEQFRDSQ